MSNRVKEDDLLSAALFESGLDDFISSTDITGGTNQHETTITNADDRKSNVITCSVVRKSTAPDKIKSALPDTEVIIGRISVFTD